MMELVSWKKRRRQDPTFSLVRTQQRVNWEEDPHQNSYLSGLGPLISAPRAMRNKCLLFEAPSVVFCYSSMSRLRQQWFPLTQEWGGNSFPGAGWIAWRYSINHGGFKNSAAACKSLICSSLYMKNVPQISKYWVMNSCPQGLCSPKIKLCRWWVTRGPFASHLSQICVLFSQFFWQMVVLGLY